MQIKSDFVLRMPYWQQMDKLMNEQGIFRRQVDIFLLALAIGISNDKIIKDDPNQYLPDESMKNIPRLVLTINDDVNERLEFMYQNALICTQHLTLSMDNRLKLAFNDDFVVEGFRPYEFLVSFANYGMDVICSKISDFDDITIDNLIDLLNQEAIVDLPI